MLLSGTRLAASISHVQSVWFKSWQLAGMEPACATCWQLTSDVSSCPMLFQVLAIDEAQFFPDLVEFCRSAVDDEGKHVIVAGLSGDFKRQRFGDLLELMPLADSIKQLKSKCAFCNQE